MTEYPYRIQTRGGRLIDPFALEADDVDLGDFCVALARIPRYLGHSSRPYSVAEHSILVAKIVGRLGGSPTDIAQSYMHDMCEAVLGDCPSPIKRRPEMAAYREAEHRALGVILRAVGLPDVLSDAVRTADLIALAMEAKALMRSDMYPKHWAGLPDIPASCADIDIWTLPNQGSNTDMLLAQTLHHRMRVAIDTAVAHSGAPQ